MTAVRSAPSTRMLALVLLAVFLVLRTGVICGPSPAMAAKPMQVTTMADADVAVDDCHEAHPADHSKTAAPKGISASACVLACAAVPDAPVPSMALSAPARIVHDGWTATILLGLDLGPAPPPPRNA